jgi:hypothetical protein
VSKNAEFHADFESLKKLLKNALKKVISKTSLTNISKSEESAFFRHVFAKNFLGGIFSKLFQEIRNQREILRFLTPFLIFSKKIFFRYSKYPNVHALMVFTIFCFLLEEKIKLKVLFLRLLTNLENPFNKLF